MIGNEVIAQDYAPVLVYSAFIMGLFFAVSLIPYFINKLRYYKAKTAPYECGFDSFRFNGSQFDVKFYLVAILFILFDLEIVFMFPWAIIVRDIGINAILAMVPFVVMMVIGFLYEVSSGALNWSDGEDV